MLLFLMQAAGEPIAAAPGKRALDFRLDRTKGVTAALRQQQSFDELTITIFSDRSADEDEHGNAQNNQAQREEHDYETEKASDEQDASNDD